jgi:hypothetical protein
MPFGSILLILFFICYNVFPFQPKKFAAFFGMENVAEHFDYTV